MCWSSVRTLGRQLLRSSGRTPRRELQLRPARWREVQRRPAVRCVHRRALVAGIRERPRPEAAPGKGPAAMKRTEWTGTARTAGRGATCVWYEEEGAKERGECEGDTHRTSHIECYARGREGKRAHCGREGMGGGSTVQRRSGRVLTYVLSDFSTLLRTRPPRLTRQGVTMATRARQGCCMVSSEGHMHESGGE